MPNEPSWYHDPYMYGERGPQPRVPRPPNFYRPPMPPGRSAHRWRYALVIAAILLPVLGAAYGLRAVVVSGMEDVVKHWDAARFGPERGDTSPFECAAVLSYEAAHPSPPPSGNSDPYGQGAQISRSMSIENVYVDPDLSGGIVIYADNSDFAIKGQIVTYAEVLVAKEGGQWKACGFQVDSSKERLLNGQTVALGWRLGGSAGFLFGRE